MQSCPIKAGGGPYRCGGKRLFDALLAGPGLILFALPMLWMALRILQESGRPILFLQPRVGRHGRVFTLLKFRTMSPEAEVTRLGKALRATAMDELPQLLNILTGRMSFVGPRPIIPEELRELDRFPGGDRRLSVRPGLTGWAQLHSDKIPSLRERLKWDLEYVDRCGLRLDLWILFKSLGVTFREAWERPGSKVSLDADESAGPDSSLR